MTPISTWPSHPPPTPLLLEVSSPRTRLLSSTVRGRAGGRRAGVSRGAARGSTWCAGCGWCRPAGAARTAPPAPAPPASRRSGCRRPTPQPPTCQGGKMDMEKALEAMRELGTAGNAPNATPNPHLRGMGAPQAAQRGLTWAGNIPGGYSASGSALASCRCHRSSCAPSGCRFSDGSRTWCTGCLRGQSVGGEVMDVGVPPGCPRSHSCIPAGIFALRCCPRFAEDARVAAGASPRTQSPPGCCGVHTAHGGCPSLWQGFGPGDL